MSKTVTSRPSFSVCMATFNGRQYLTAQLRSIIDQMNESDELILVDDHSTDDTVAIAEAVLESCRANKVTLVRLDRNRGHRGAFAHAVALANCALVTLADQDDLWAHNRLSILADDMSSTSTDMTFGSLTTFGLSSRTNMLNRDRVLRGRRGLMEFAFRWPGKQYAYGSACAFKRDVVDSSIPITTEAHEYWLIAQGLAGRGVHFTERVVTFRRIHGKNLTSRRRLNQRLLARWRTALAMAAIMHRAKASE